MSQDIKLKPEEERILDSLALVPLGGGKTYKNVKELRESSIKESNKKVNTRQVRRKRERQAKKLAKKQEN